MSDANGLMQYGQDIIALEVLKREYASMNQTMDHTIISLGIEEAIEEAEYEKAPTFFTLLFSSIGVILLGALAFFAVAFVIGIPTSWGLVSEDAFNFIVKIPIAVAALILIGVIIFGISKKINVANENKKTRHLNATNFKNAQEKQDEKNKQKSKLQVKQIDTIKVKESVESKLNELYAKSNIYPDYQNMEAVYKMFQYIDSGRCESLSGTHGAYNLYENERRLDEIIKQLKNINRNLGVIGAGIQTLYNQVNETNRLLSGIEQEISGQKALMAKKFDSLLDKIDRQNRYIEDDLLKRVDQNLNNMERRDFQRFHKHNDYFPIMKF